MSKFLNSLLIQRTVFLMAVLAASLHAGCSSGRPEHAAVGLIRPRATIAADTRSSRAEMPSHDRQREPLDVESATPNFKASAPLVLADIENAHIYRLRPGDLIAVRLAGIPDPDQFQDVIDGSGNINVMYVGTLRAAGKTTSELEHAMESSYIDNKIYKSINVSVMLPSQSYYVRGEVLQPGRFPLMAGITLLQAIASAGGYSQYANPKKIQILRAGDRKRFDVKHIEKHPEKDIDVEAGDVIIIPRSVF